MTSPNQQDQEILIFETESTDPSTTPIRSPPYPNNHHTDPNEGSQPLTPLETSGVVHEEAMCLVDMAPKEMVPPIE